MGKRGLLRQFAPDVVINHKTQYPFSYSGRIFVNHNRVEPSIDDLTRLGVPSVFASLMAYQDGVAHETRHHAQALAFELASLNEGTQDRIERVQREKALIPWAIDWESRRMKRIVSNVARPKPGTLLIEQPQIANHPKLAKLKALARSNNSFVGYGKDHLQHQLALRLATEDSLLIPMGSPVYVFAPTETDAWATGTRAWTGKALKGIVPNNIRGKVGSEQKKRLDFLQAARTLYTDLINLRARQIDEQDTQAALTAARSSYQTVKRSGLGSNYYLFKKATQDLPRFLSPELQCVID
jgi:hypothetical protein